jgi:diguanylate cyclase (GGDEF)-like protein
MMNTHRAGSKGRVLVVEDSAVQRKHLRDLLEARGYDVAEASGGVDALRQIKANTPDVVVLDVILDDLDGYSVCRWLRLSEKTREVVVIMLTVKGGVKERVEGLHVGADDYVPKPFDDDELEARIFAALRARGQREELRQRNAELETMLSASERLAMTDVVTGIFNRRRFLDMLSREWATARRYGNSLSVALLDLDGFKQINDLDGHGAGDDALKRVAKILVAATREVDVCARYGGDEFAIMFPHTERAKARVAIERAQARLVAERKLWPGAQRQVGMSAGIASTEDATLQSPDQLIEAADRALYEAKRSHRAYVIADDKILTR